MHQLDVKEKHVQHHHLKRSINNLAKFLFMTFVFGTILSGLGYFAFVYVDRAFREKYSDPYQKQMLDQISSIENTKISYTFRVEKKFIVLGDIMLARTIGDKIDSGENPFANVQETLNLYDYRIGNVETNISLPDTGSALIGKLYTFKAPLSSLGTLKNARIDIGIMANNHVMDFGNPALVEMRALLEENGIKPLGAGSNLAQAYEPVVLTTNYDVYNDKGVKVDFGVEAKLPELKVAFVAINDIETWYSTPTENNPGVAYFNEGLIHDAITRSKQEYKADIVVVIPHWGFEYQTFEDANQQAWGRMFVDWGADLVVGGHPHVVQPSEEYNGKMIYFSLGNFVFDNMDGAEEGQILQFYIEGDISQVDFDSGKVPVVKITNQKLIYIRLDEVGFPKIL